MQKLLLLLISTSTFVSCTKNASKTSNLSQDSTTLISITGDSADFSFGYEDGKVTDVLARHDDGIPYGGDSFYALYAHLSYDSVNYVKVTSTEEHPNYSYTEYFLNEDKTPKKIIIHFRNNEVTDVVDFFYNSRTNLLDSVHDTNDGGTNFTSAYMHYDGEDITSAEVKYTYGTNTFTRPTEYIYDKTQPNIFKTLDPFWYIYDMPFGTYNYQTSWVQFNFWIYSKLFSQHAFTQIRSNYYFNNDWDTLHYSLNSAGKLEKEWYSSYPAHITQYNYGN